MAEVPKASANLNNHLQNHPGGNRRGVKLKWLCCFMKPAEAEENFPKTFKGVHVSRDVFNTRLPCTVYPEELACLEAEGNIYECGCCYFETPFEKLVQCADGHLFCFTCLKRRVEDCTFGVVPANGPLACMYMGGCEKFIPWSEIQRSIEKGLLIKFEQRQAADDVAHAQLPGLFYCPACNLACVVDPNVVVFKCPSNQCGKATCMKCEEPFHEGPCYQNVEKPLETQARKEVEEVMSKSLIRECAACKAKLIKYSGCNKINCRCGKVMCYTCRQPIKGYSHFCEHKGYKDQKCRKCGRCKLWHKEDDAAVVQAARKVAIDRKAKKDPKISTLQIGPPETFPSKKSS